MLFRMKIFYENYVNINKILDSGTGEAETSG